VFTSLIVNSTSGTLFAGAGLLSLPEAVVFANADSSGNAAITFDATVFANPQTINVSGGQLELSNTSEAESITGPAAGVTVHGSGLSGVFQVDKLVTASISGLTITGGNAAGFFGLEEAGGGVNNNGTLTMANCTVSGNSGLNGSGMANFGTLTMTNCTVSGNSGLNGGGSGVANFGMLTMTNCTLSGNSAHFGGVTNGGTLTMTNCTLSGNSAFLGGGVANAGTLTMTNCTVSGNSATVRGGGVENVGAGTVTMTNCTLSGNSSPNGGGLFNMGSPLHVGNTIVAGNTASVSGPDVQGSVASQGHNLIGKTNGSSGWVGSDLTGTSANPLNPLLAPLGPSGGSTATMALLPGSPAIDAGSNALIPASVTTDQRGTGFPRAVNGTVDIGAFEVDTTTVVTSSSANNTSVYGQDVTFTATVTPAISGTPTGTVQFYVNGSPVGSAVTLSGGQAMYDAGTTLNVATYQVTAVYSSNSSFDSSGSAARSFTVTPAPLTVTAASPSMTYGGTVPALTYTYTGLVNNDQSATFSGALTTSATSSSSVGGYAITQGNLAATGNYTIGAFNAGTLTVNPAPLTVTAASPSMTYGGTVPALTYTYNGLVNNDTSATFSGALATSATSSSSVGGYAITQGTLTATGNYTIGAFNPGTVTVSLLPGSVFVLNNTRLAGALTLSGNASIQTSGQVVVDSSSASAVIAGGKAQVSASGGVLVAGGVKVSGQANVHSTGTPAATADPLANLAAPSATGLQNRGTVKLSKGPVTLQPGIYTKIALSGSAQVTFAPGVYVIAGGGFTMSGNASATGTGVTIYNAGSKWVTGGLGGTFGAITVSGKAICALNAPTSGAYAGILFFQARDNKQAVALSSSGTLSLNGALYAPAAAMTISGNANAELVTLLVAHLTISSNGKVT